MTTSGIARRRLRNHLLVESAFDDPADVVRWMGALQAQDYGQSLWAIGARLRTPTLSRVLEAIESGRILRTWPMRGTIHWVPAEDAAWMVAVSAERTIAASRRRITELGLDSSTIALGGSILADELSGGRRMRRPDVMELWQRAGVDTSGQRGYHLLWQLAHQGLIAIGPMDGKQQTFVLLAEWAPNPRRLDRDAGLAELARRYLTSHGPATASDFAWWAGIPLTTARQVGTATGLVETDVGGRTLWQPQTTAPPVPGVAGVQLVAAFDEYALSYADRSDVLAPDELPLVVPGRNGIFNPCVLDDGRVVGTWKRVIGPRTVDIDIRPFSSARLNESAVRAAAERYAEFLGLPMGAFSLTRPAGAPGAARTTTSA